MLVLFDIDGTLLTGDGVGMRALVEGGRAVFGGGFRSEGVAYSGRLDPLIVGDLLELNGAEDTAEARAALRGAYVGALEAELVERPVRALAGAAGLVERFGREPGVTVGLLTGNFAESGGLKLRSAGFDVEAFGVRVWGDESPEDPPHRNDLPAVATARYEARAGAAIEPGRVLVIGDTPGDVECAAVNGHRSLAVTTGRFGVAELAGADRVTASLEAVEELAGWALATMGCGGRRGR